MKDINMLVRENIRKLSPYSTARDECKEQMDIYLDANESPYNNGVNRYPMPLQDKLRKKISLVKNINPDNLFIGNGSDEAIDLVYRIFCKPGIDNAIIVSPTYGMYKVAAEINDVKVIETFLEDDFSLKAENVLCKVNENTKIIFICSPNNPTGNLLDVNQIKTIIESFAGIVVVDEAYITYADNEMSFTNLIKDFNNLIVLQTLSKAYAMAGLRIGLAISNARIITYMNSVKYPYNINVLSQDKAIELLENRIELSNEVRETIEQREYLAKELIKCKDVEKVYPSDANFLLVKLNNKEKYLKELKENGIIVRDKSKDYNCSNCIRITVGTPYENSRVLNCFNNSSTDVYCKASTQAAKNECGIDCSCKTACKTSCKTACKTSCKTACKSLCRTNLQNNSRSASISRTTKETDIIINVNLDKYSSPQINTGLNFFNHMLEQIAYHSGIGLAILCKGDLAVDDHHTIEDVAIALGDCLLKALGDKKGIERYGFCLPMDESQACVLLDLGGRIDFNWEVDLKQARTGDVNNQMFKHFFKSLAEHLKCNLHIKANGENDHHIIEGVFKAFARTLKCAIRKDSLNNRIPSSKESL